MAKHWSSQGVEHTVIGIIPGPSQSAMDMSVDAFGNWPQHTGEFTNSRVQACLNSKLGVVLQERTPGGDWKAIGPAFFAHGVPSFGVVNNRIEIVDCTAAAHNGDCHGFQLDSGN